MEKAGKLVVLRFSAMGDVAMVASVLKELSIHFPHLRLIMVTRKAFAPFFEGIPGLTFHAFEPKTKHRGLLGLYRLYQELRAYQPTGIADLHDHLRTRIVSLFFRLDERKIVRIDKGRSEKRRLTRTRHKILLPLKPTVERYASVFRELGYPFQLKHQLQQTFHSPPESFERICMPGKKRIAIAPFAQHPAKVYAPQGMEKVMSGLKESDYQLFIFGGGEAEKQQAAKWEEGFSNVTSLIGRYTLSEELAILSTLDAMISMDSSGMHMASLVGLRVISIWGPTHPYAGFLGYGQSLDDCIQADCPGRPNSVYGNKMLYSGVTPCIDLITPEEIIQKVTQLS